MGHLAGDVLVELVDIDVAVIVGVGVAFQALVQPIAEERLLLVFPDLALLIGGGTGNGDHAFQVLERVAEVLGGRLPLGVLFVFAFFRAGVAGVDQQQLELGLAPGNLVAEPFNGNAGGGGVLRIDVQGSKVHLAAGVAEAVPAEINDQRVGGARFLEPGGQLDGKIGLQRLLAGIDRLVGHLQDILRIVTAVGLQRGANAADVVDRILQAVGVEVLFARDEHRPAARRFGFRHGFGGPHDRRPPGKQPQEQASCERQKQKAPRRGRGPQSGNSSGDHRFWSLLRIVAGTLRMGCQKSR